MVREELFNDIRKAIVEGDKPRAQELAREAIGLGSYLNEVIDKGYVPGIQTVGELWEKGEYFLPELISSAECIRLPWTSFSRRWPRRTSSPGLWARS